MVVPHFELIDATLELNETLILKDVSLTIQNQTLTCISGENGSGKSCLISILLKLHTCTRGTQISTFNKRELCYIPAQPFFFDTERVYTCIRLMKSLYATSMDTLIHVMDSLNLDYHEIRQKRFGDLSSGMKQKLNILPLFLDNLSIFFLDELTQNLDTESIHAIETRINHLISTQKTIVMIDHNNEFMNQLHSKNKEHYRCENKTVIKL